MDFSHPKNLGQITMVESIIYSGSDFRKIFTKYSEQIKNRRTGIFNGNPGDPYAIKLGGVTIDMRRMDLGAY